MTTKQDQSTNRLLKKLSALRATLKGEELILLDSFIIGSPDEVAAHAMGARAAAKGKVTAASTAPDEVAAHSIRSVVTFDPVKGEYRLTQ